MNFPTILLIGGTGKTGKRIAQQLDAKGIAYSVATRRPVQPEDRFFDWQQPVSNELFKGITAVYIVAPTHTSDHHYIVPPVLRQALAQGVKRFVLLSASSLEEGGPAMGQIHAFLHKYAPEWCVLRPFNEIAWIYRFGCVIKCIHRPPVIAGNNRLFVFTPTQGINFVTRDSNDKKTLMCLNLFARGQRHDKAALSSGRARIGPANTGFFIKFSERRLLEGFALLYATARRCPVCLACECILCMHKTKQQQVMGSIEDQ